MMEETTNNNAATTQDKNTAQQTSTSTATEGSPKRETVTQAEKDQEYAERAARAAASATKKLLDKLGLTSEDQIPALKITIDKALEIEQANLSAAEKAEKSAEAALKRAELAEQLLNTERTERRNDRISNYLLSKAGEMKATDTETVLLYARDKHKAELDALIGEDGTLDETKAKKLLEIIKTEKPVYFVAVLQGAGSPSNAGGRAMASDADAMKRFSANNQRTIRGR